MRIDHLLPPRLSAIVTVCMAFLCLHCGPGPQEQEPLTNLSHLDRLYMPVQMHGNSAAVIRATAEPPEFIPGPMADGRFASVQDAARATVVYLWRAESAADTAAVSRAESLLRFILSTQDEEGTFSNWIAADLQPLPFPAEGIFGRTTARAVWALGEGIRVLSLSRPETAAALWSSLRRTYGALDRALVVDETEEPGSWPAWLDDGGAAAEMLLGLIAARTVGDQSQLDVKITHIANALLRTQAGDSTAFPYYAFLSQSNRWTGAGNAQADALCWAGQAMHQLEWFNAGFFEARQFYPYLLSLGLPAEFKVESGSPQVSSVRATPEMIRPAVHALLNIYGLTREQRFAVSAGQFAAWLLGRNDSGRALYDPLTGRGFDDSDHGNRFAGAASANATVEALLTFLPAEMDPVVRAAIDASTL